MKSSKYKDCGILRVYANISPTHLMRSGIEATPPATKYRALIPTVICEAFCNKACAILVVKSLWPDGDDISEVATLRKHRNKFRDLF